MIGPAMPPAPGAEPQGPTVGRRTTVGPAPRPTGLAGLGLPAFTEVHEAPVKPTKSFIPAPVEAGGLDNVAVTASRKGELPPSGWATKWSPATKKAALEAAIEDAQMHVVYALRPQSGVWQESVGSVALEQETLNKLLRRHAAAKGREQRARGKEAAQWLLDNGASLEGLCADADFEVRAAAANILSNMGEEGAAKAASFLSSSDWRCRCTAVETLAKFGKAAAKHSEALAAMLGDSESLVRMAATSALGKLGTSAAPHCAKALKSDKAREREAAAEALGQMGPAAAAEYAADIAALLMDSDWQVPTAAANALQRLGPSAAASHCVEVLKKCNQTSRAAVAEALGRLGGEETANQILPLLRHGDEAIRKYAVDAMGFLGSDSVSQQHVAALMAMRSDEDRDVRRAVREAIHKLGHGPPLPDVVGNGDAMPPPPQGLVGKGKGGKGKGSNSPTRSRSPRGKGR